MFKIAKHDWNTYRTLLTSVNLAQILGSKTGMYGMIASCRRENVLIIAGEEKKQLLIVN